MVPSILRLNGFTSYKTETVLDFNKLGIFLLSGDNGAGKSSLLEAITWVIWGKTRSLSDDELVAEGATDMKVELEIEDEGREFRILRQRNVSGRGKSKLDVFLRRKKSDEWMLQNGVNLRRTEEMLVAALNLSYETFINSVYLRQGHADEFTTKPPSDRKRVLAEILRLGVWDELGEVGRDKLRESKILVLNLERDILLFETAEQGRADLVENYRGVLLRLNKISDEIKIDEAELREKRAVLDSIESELKNIEFLRTSESGLLLKISKSKDEDATARQTEELLKTKLNDRESVERAVSDLAKFENNFNELKLKLEPYLNAETTLRDKKFKLSADKHVIETKKQGLLDQVNLIKERGKKRALSIIDKAECPLCLRVFDSEHSKEACIEKIRDEVRSETKPLIDEIRNLEAQDSFSMVETEIIELEKRVIELNKLKSDMFEIESEVKRLEPERKRFLELDLDNERLTDVKKSRVYLKEQIIEAESELKRIRDEINLKQEQLGNVSAENLNIDVLQLNRALEIKNQTLRVEQEALASTKLQIKKLDDDKVKLKENQNEILRQRRRLRNLEEFIEACGKHGIQTMILAETLPQLEERANELLGQLSAGRMHLNFQTERQKKSGEGTIDTLDILVSDLEGERSYELFSGGEAFRINIAIRIALSLYLAERAGAEIEFLIIDEGFGSLDSSGREAVIDVLLTLESRFKKIMELQVIVN